MVSEVNVPGGSVDYCLVSAQNRKVKDFAGLELQTLDTTGTVWPARQRFLNEFGIQVRRSDVESRKGFGMKWKMTAKTVLVQLHHKIETFEFLNKHLVLVAQDHLIKYIQREFSFDHLNPARVGDPMHIHAYRFGTSENPATLQLADRLSTDTNGISVCLGLHASANTELERIVALLESKISDSTLLTL